MTLVTRACDPVMWPNHVTAVMIVLPVMALCAWVLQRHHRHPQQQQQAIRNRIFGEKQKAEFPAGPAASPQLSSLFDHERRSFNLKDWLSWDLGEVRAERRTALLRCQGCRLKCLFCWFFFFFSHWPTETELIQNHCALLGNQLTTRFCITVLWTATEHKGDDANGKFKEDVNSYLYNWKTLKREFLLFYVVEFRSIPSVWK